jgi:hypothetical protein
MHKDIAFVVALFFSYGVYIASTSYYKFSSYRRLINIQKQGRETIVNSYFLYYVFAEDHWISIFVCEVEKCDLCIESSFNKPTRKEDWETGKED